jgi:hypothetical protein
LSKSHADTDEARIFKFPADSRGSWRVDPAREHAQPKKLLEAALRSCAIEGGGETL